MPEASEKSDAPRILVVDDDPTQADTLSKVLALEGFDTVCAYAPASAIEEVARRRPDIIVSDFRMPGMTGVELFKRVQNERAPIIFIIITAFGTMQTVVEAMRAGVQDFLTKPVNGDELLERIKKSLRVRSLERENIKLRRTVDTLRERVNIVGESREIREILSTVEQISRSPATVLLTGESGTGKELVARALHLESPRQAGPYVRVNCAAIPDNLLEDELFGHAKGAFTGAVKDRKGKFELADDGTIFLDEVGDLPIHLQPKLLRVLQEREVEPIGSNRTLAIDVRVIAATHQDLRRMVELGTFREDLFYRLNVIPLEIPPLRDRQGDIRLLAQHFLKKYCDENSKKISGFSAEAFEKLETYSWPGNVRELENCVERVVVLATGDIIDEGDLLLSGPRRDGVVDATVDALFDGPLTLDELERQILLTSLERCGGNLSRTARTLGMTRRALQYRAEKIKGSTNEPTGDDDEQNEG